MKVCRECGEEFVPQRAQTLVCSEACRRARARQAKRTYRRKAIGQLAEARYRQTPPAMELARQRSQKHYRKRKGVEAWVHYWEHRLERFRARSLPGQPK